MTEMKPHSFWRFPDRSMTGGCMLAAGFGLILYALGRLATFGMLDLAWLLLFSGIALSVAGIHWLSTPHRGYEVEPVDPVEPYYAPMPAAMVESAHSHLSPDVLSNPQYIRLRESVENPGSLAGSNKKPWGVVSAAEVVDGELRKYVITTAMGVLLSKKAQTDRSQQLKNLLPTDVDARWDVVVEAPLDTITGTLIRTTLPTAVAPAPVEPPKTIEEAIAAYPKLRWRFGVDSAGNEINARLETQPHIALIATTGGGKSVLASSLLEMLRPYASCWIFDGKGSDYPASLVDLAGISWISKTPHEHIVGMRWLWDEMNERYEEVERRKSQGRAKEAFDFPTIFVLIDELPSLRGRMSKVDSKDKGELFDFYVNDLLQKGRQARIHLCLISQSLRVAAVPGWWQENLKQIIFLGPVSSRSMDSDAVPEAVRAEVSDVTSRISEDTRGRGVYITTENSKVVPILFQSYWAYSPGTTALSKAPNPEIRRQWETARDAVHNLPRFYDRVGIRVDGPEWRDMPMADLAETPTIVVADENGAIPGREIYDPLSPAFLGAAPADGAKERARGRGSVAAERTSAL